jgi:hypothetical protein
MRATMIAILNHIPGTVHFDTFIRERVATSLIWSFRLTESILDLQLVSQEHSRT